ncbi:Serine/threonine-protein phosphatase 7 long form [Sesamum angolense]|uniref:Serine/threonine-protein phosphatase 7 long form n=1 Tax=Sesamum angolense TaxID=2727404 RepID=A0AAE1W9M9_9LAMI|nr:Serine/threonine-protein phosphatase 7 long form [Sesamum angolense]
MDITQDFGPRDPSVLYQQENHLSQNVVAGLTDSTLHVRRGGLTFAQLIQKAPRHPRVLQLLYEMGFYGVLRCGHIEIDNHLITALVERWRPETHTFHFPVGEATVTLQDIALLWGLPIAGQPVIGKDKKKSTEEWQDYCLRWLGYRPDTSSLRHSNLKMSTLTQRLLNHPVNDDSNIVEVMQEARICALCLLSGVMCPDAQGSHVSLFYLRYMENICDTGSYSWGTAVLGYLYRELCVAAQIGKVNIGGAMHLLQIWAWSRITTLTPQKIDDKIGMGPIVVDEDSILPIPPYGAREMFDRMVPGEFIWQPYDMDSDEVQSLPDAVAPHLWTAKCPLIHHAIVEIHHAERVLRQFGMIQDIPPLPDVSERKLHSIDRRGRHGEDWAWYHREYVAQWANVQELVVRKPMIQPGGPSMVDDYMRWYYQITRIRVSKSLEPNTIGYHPTNLSDWQHVVDRLKQLVVSCDTVDDDDLQALNQLRVTCRGIATDLIDYSRARYPAAQMHDPIQDSSQGEHYCTSKRKRLIERSSSSSRQDSDTMELGDDLLRL